MTNKVTTVRFHIGGDDEIKTEHNRREESTIKWEQHIDMEGKHEVLRDMSIRRYQRILYTMSGQAVADPFRANHKIASGFFPRFVNQQNQFLLGNMLPRRCSAMTFGRDMEEP